MAYVTRTPGHPDELRHGYTMADLERVARTAAAATRAMAGDYHDRYTEAFSAAAEHLYTVEHPPPEHDLFRAAQDALWTQSHKDRSYHGCAYRHGDGWQESGTGPNFARFWLDLNSATPSPENRVVDRLALTQILPTLSPGMRAAINALALTGDYEQAWTWLNANPQTFRNQVGNARARFLHWWHEGEQPSRPWAMSRSDNTRTVSEFLNRRAGNPARPAAPTSTRLPSAQRPTCPQGHPYNEDNTRYRPNGNRVCRTCEQNRKKRRAYRPAVVS